MTRDLLSGGAVEGRHIGIIAHDDAYLAEAVAEWACASLRSGGGAILVGTALHLEGVRRSARRHRVDMASTERSGRAVLIEADWLLAKFMIDGTPDGARFRALLDDIMTPLAARVGTARNVRAWGEMVSLLHARGNAEAARRLEAMWEISLQQKGFSLLCTYQTPGPDAPPTADLVDDVRRSHASVHVQPRVRPAV